ncbi:MAG: alpha-amylase/4-alpha-glucanotransferase domain-containing protein [Campylobacterota bacterium]|nr:alpha-amylase/4-alpha-glucanotransferase domain-containing protein [Campylobacterota bacterium]
MKTSLLFGIHCHQPIDNFDWVIYDAIKKSYKPFFETLEKFPDFKCSVHFSGSLFEFIEKNDTELFDLIKKLSPQIEFFSGGFYEPVLASIPSKDRVAQIKKLNRYIKKHFSQTPKGLWLTERVWDNSIIKDIKACGIEYVMVDDYHIKTSGLDTDTTNGYFITEDGGETIGLFPINQDLRYAIPFYSLEDTNRLINDINNNSGKNAAIIFDDGEKFGIWPNTYETVYEKKWLEDFFTQTLEDKNIEVQTFKDYYNSNKPIALTYLQTVSYFEMGEWSLKADDTIKLEEMLKEDKINLKFLRGGTWKNFFTKYQESNWIHKRVLELSKKQIDNKAYKEALYKAQCNDVLWHGVFGGIYLPNLRDNAYKYIIECEKILDNKKERLDIELNGYDDYKFANDELLTIISSKNGGQIFELDLIKNNYNLQNTLTRYKEAYHKNIEIEDEQKESDNIKTIHDNMLTVSQDISLDYDWYLKKSAIDHIVPLDMSLEEFAKNSFKELADFVNQPFEVEKSSKEQLKLKREGGIYLDKKYDTILNKSYKFKKNRLSLISSISSNYKKNLNYIQEWNLHFANIKNVTFNGAYLETDKLYSNLEVLANTLTINDSYLKRTLKFNTKNIKKIYISSLNTISQSEQGVDITNQGVTIGFIYNLKESSSYDISLEVL